MTTIPKQLRNTHFRFVKIQKGKKGPFEKKWQKTGNYKYNEKEFQNWIKKGNNYGVVCGFGDLVVIDCDKEKVERKVEETLPETFKIKTGRGGAHFYYICPDLDKPIRMIEEKMGDIGDIQHEGKQVVGPGSKHPNGNKYKIANNKPVAEIHAEEIRFALRDFIKQASDRVKEGELEYVSDVDQLQIQDVVDMSNLVQKAGGEYQGAHPLHDSDTGSNFCVNTAKNVWHCFRHDSGGGPLSWIAVKEGLINCSDAQPNYLRSDKFKKTLQIATQKYGLTLKNNTPPFPVEKGGFRKTDNKTGGTTYLGQKQAKTTTSLAGTPGTTFSYKSNKKGYILLGDGNMQFQEFQNEAEMWEYVRQMFVSGYLPKKECRFKANEALKSLYHFKTHPRTETLYIFENSTYRPNGRQVIRKKLRDELESLVSNHDLREIVTAIRDENYVELDAFQQKEMFIAAANKDLLVEPTGKIDEQEITPDRIVMARLPWNYNPDAKCPKIKEFIHDIVKEEWVDTIQEMVGLTLLNKLVTRKAFMLYGAGANGKDILLALIERLLGRENISNHTLHYLEYNRFASASLVGKLANISGDLSQREMSDCSRFKRITGGSTIEIEQKGKDSYNYEPFSTLIFAANQTPSFKEDTYALYDRWVIITFPYKFTFDEDDGYKNRIEREKLLAELTTKEEMEGFFNWAIKGAQRVLNSGGIITNQQPPEKIKEAWQKRGDSITVFAKLRLEEDMTAVVSKRELYDEYVDWCVKNSYSPEVMQTMGRDLPTRIASARADAARIDGVKTKVWKGIKIKEVEGRKANEDDILGIYPSPLENPEEYIKIEQKAEANIGVKAEDLYEWHRRFKEKGDIYEPEAGKWKRT